MRRHASLLRSMQTRPWFAAVTTRNGGSQAESVCTRVARIGRRQESPGGRAIAPRGRSRCGTHERRVPSENPCAARTCGSAARRAVTGGARGTANCGGGSSTAAAAGLPAQSFFFAVVPALLPAESDPLLRLSGPVPQTAAGRLRAPDLCGGRARRNRAIRRALRTVDPAEGVSGPVRARGTPAGRPAGGGGGAGCPTV
jgi:hypothetical protein